MKGENIKLAAYMQGSTKRFAIPVYQRNYDWKIEQCKQLFDDLVRVVKNKRKSHFFGSIVSVYNSEAQRDEYLIIDGQQRLTTVSLMLLAICHLISNREVRVRENRLDERILEEYLIDKWHGEESRVKLKPVKNDRDAFDKLFSDSRDHVQDSNVTINYQYYYDRIKKEEISVDDLFDAICRLEIINIKLNQDDNPQLIFESLNSTGLALNEGDKIRNYVLMGLPTRKQNDFYERYWHKIELCTKYDVSSFIRDYLSVKQQSIPSQSKVYFTFKDYVEENQLETEELLQNILAYARRYGILLSGKTPNNGLNATIYRLNRLETTVTRPFFLEVLRLHDEGSLSIKQVAEIFAITESYLFRRTICDLPTNTLNKIFLLLHKEIVRYDSTAQNYIEKMKFAIMSKKERARFPSDAEFVEALSARQVYTMHSKNRIYIFERIENAGTLEDKDVYRQVDAGVYTIEHIMPQHLTPAWAQHLGPDYQEIHATWLHRLANLTLTAYNGPYSDSTFLEKRNHPKGFIDSGIRMNVFISRFESWTEAVLLERNQHLMEKALAIWPSFETAYMPEEKQLEAYSLDEDEAFRGRVIVRFKYQSIEQPVNSWVDMLESVLRMLHAEDKSVLAKIAFSPDENDELSTFISGDMQKLRRVIELEEGLYVEKNINTETKLSLLRRIFRLFNADPADLIFYLREENAASNHQGIGVSEELRLRFWAYALPAIQEAFGPEGPFANVNPSKLNWISGFFGIGGFSIGCIANYREARVELYMDGETQLNKMMFDYLYEHKDKVEAALATSMDWDRGDDKKSSKISVSLHGVSVGLEDDWSRMTSFLAAWSKKIYDVLVPYLWEKAGI